MIDSADHAWNDRLKPVRIAAGALGHGLPVKDLLVSRHHRMLIASNAAKRMFGACEVLVPAIKLVGLDCIGIAEDVTSLTYDHLQ